MKHKHVGFRATEPSRYLAQSLGQFSEAVMSEHEYFICKRSRNILIFEPMPLAYALHQGMLVAMKPLSTGDRYRYLAWL